MHSCNHLNILEHKDVNAGRENKTKPLSNSKQANLPVAYSFLKHERDVIEIKLIFHNKEKIHNINATCTYRLSLSLLNTYTEEE